MKHFILSCLCAALLAISALTAAPHIAGSPEDKKTGAFVAQKFREAGLARTATPLVLATSAGAGTRLALLPVPLGRHTMYDMKTSAVTIRLEPELQKLLDKVCKQSGRTRSDILREALKRQLSLLRFEQLRRQVLPLAEARGYLTDEDVNKAVS
jgi:predicted transcriptional regulator